MKAKTYAVNLDGVVYLVEALTVTGAVRDVVDEVTGAIRKRAMVDLATGEQLYQAGKKGLRIINADRYATGDDQNQLPLTGVPETAAEAK